MKTEYLFTFKLNKRSTNVQVRLILMFENSSQRENAVMRCMHYQTTEQLICPEHIIRFACLSTCPGCINRRNVLLCCTLERKQRVVASVLSSSKCLRVLGVNKRPKKTNLLKTAKTVTYCHEFEAKLLETESAV